MSEEAELEVLLSLDGHSYEAAAGYVVEFVVRRTEKTAARPHGVSYPSCSVRRTASHTCASTMRMRSTGLVEGSSKGRKSTIIGTERKPIPDGPTRSRPQPSCSTTSGAR